MTTLEAEKPATPFKERPDGRPLICGFLKVRNEIFREGNLVRALQNLRKFCDTIVACDDASFDGTRELLQREIPADQLILVPLDKQDFRDELLWKQRMLDLIHEQVKPHWIWWHDADEELDEEGVAGIRDLCEQQIKGSVHAYRFHYIQLWRNQHWHRVDDGFADGYFIKLWRWSPALSFRIVQGTHHDQFPEQLLSNPNRLEIAPWKVIHWGNFGKSLQWKCIQYYGGLGGVERHLSFERGSFLPVTRGVVPAVPAPTPFTKHQKDLILRLKDLRRLEGTFTVVIPTFNRGWALDETLTSLLTQTYDKWIAIVLDDGSTDNTFDLMQRWQEQEPRIFYGRYDKVGAVAMNEIGCNTALQCTEWWTRLGSDDYFEPHKLALDAMALTRHEWVYGPYRVLRDGKLAEVCNVPMAPEQAQQTLRNGNFVISWANVAVRSSVLHKVKTTFGSFCDPALRNMEDFLMNTRLARFAAPVFRGKVGNMIVVNQSDPTMIPLEKFDHDAIWRVSTDGASSNLQQTANEDELTRAIIARENGAADPTR